jgi:hypothetical protein
LRVPVKLAVVYGHARSSRRPIAARFRHPDRLTDVLVTGIAVIVVAAPLVGRSNYSLDFVNHLWLAWAAGKMLVQAGHPTYFINTTTQGVFNPWLAFYGGTLMDTTGAIAELTRHPYLAYAGVTVIAIVAAYVGTVSIARQFGIRGLIAHAPALCVVTSAYYITDLYQRGAWSEFMALSAIPPLVASGIYLIRASNWPPAVVLVFTVSAVVLSGSHNITLLWSVTIGVLVLLVMWLVLGRPRHLPYRRLAMVGALGVLAALVNAWFLVTDVVYARDTFAATYKTIVVGAVAAWDTPGNLFDPFRAAPVIPMFPWIYVQVPDWFLVWGVLAGLALAWSRRAGERLRRVWAGWLIVIAIVLAMIIDTSFWSQAPYPFREIQFPFRLNGYVLFAVAGVVLVGALAVQQADAWARRPRSVLPLQFALVAVAAVSLALCLWQEWVPSTSGPGYVNRHAAFVSPNALPPSWYDPGSFVDHSAPVVAVPPGRVLTIPPGQVRGDRFAGLVDVPSGLQPIQTNIAGGDYVVAISGLRWVGRSASGYAVVRRLRNGTGPVRVVIDTARTAAMVLGSILSVVAIVALLVILVCATVVSRRASRARPATSEPTDGLEAVPGA